MKMSVQQFCLRWNNHQPNFISVCSSLRHNGTLVDVTLAAEGRQLQAHKIVLSACSSYFQTLFTSNPCQHPIVILKDVQYNDLKTMVDFMYYGEVNVSQEQLPHILKTAEMLKIKGLAEMPDAAASLTKSESKSTSDQTDTLQGAGSGSESLWGSAESQFQHHHHHHQTQTQAQHHQQRRSPSPAGAGASPATRRKRLRKSSNSGSTERTSEEQSSIEGSSNINLSQMSQMAFGGNASNLAQTIHSKIIKESSSTDTEPHPQDSSQESMEDSTTHHHVQQIKPESEIPGVQQSLPLDISGPGTPTEHDAPSVTCSQSQSSHSGVQWTVVDSNYPRFSLPACQGSISIGDNSQAGDSANNATNGQQQNASTSTGNSVVTTNQQAEKQTTSVIGTKRNRFLIRQPRIKRDSDTNQQSPEVMEFDLLSPHSGLLSVPPPKIERHASEPAPSLAPSSPHLLSVPQSTPFLVKQHSHPLLPSQSPPTSSIALTGFSLHRQLSHPTQSSPSMTVTEPVLSTNASAITTSPYTPNTGLHFVSTTVKQEPEQTVPIKCGGQSPSVILVSDPLATSTHAEHIPTIRMKGEELRRSASSPQATRELSLENPRSSHCPVIRPGPALGCNFCWNTIDAHGRILRRKTKYHCPECQTNLCIVPCFQEYHERQSSENPSNENTPLSSSKSLPSTSLRHYPKTGSI